MSQFATLLIELGTEELPPKALRKLAKALADNFFAGLKEAQMLGEQAACEWFASPRRLALRITEVAKQQPDRAEQRRGPALAAAFDDAGNATKAAQGFAKSCGVSVEQLARMETAKGTWLVFDQVISGQPIAAVAQQCLQQSIKALPIPKRMRWGAREQEFVRPVHWLLALLGKEVLALECLGLVADRQSRGHRFLHGETIQVAQPSDYEQELNAAHVMVDHQQRQQLILQQCEELAQSVGATLNASNSLLEEVTGLVEWPQALMGEFDEAFLDVPREVLIAAMEDHQKYFYLTDADGKLLPRFITVSNIPDNTADRVIIGNQRVLKARLADAVFFWQQDRKDRLDSKIHRLDGLLFHKRLGSVLGKSQRLADLAARIADHLDADVEQVHRAAALCKVDLITDMVGEFPALQGILGNYYAKHDGEHAAVADAIESHYYPRFAGDVLPQHRVSITLALADRLDSMVGLFAAGEIPTGDKDPYALRRMALGIIRICIEKELEISLSYLLDLSVDAYEEYLPDLAVSREQIALLAEFIQDRLKAYFLPLGYHAETVQAVQASNPHSLYDFALRVQATQGFFDEQAEAAQALAAANKRIANILAKQQHPIQGEVDAKLLQDDAEVALAQAVHNVTDSYQNVVGENDYQGALNALATLKQPIDTFFDEVMVMADDSAIRENRLRLLQHIRALFLAVADVSLLKVDS